MTGRRPRFSLAFDVQCKGLGLPTPKAEFYFAKPRRWRFDWAFPVQLIAVEQEGGVFNGGRHTRGVGFVKDMEKYNAATRLGWRVLRFTPKQVRDGMAALYVASIIGGNIVDYRGEKRDNSGTHPESRPDAFLTE